MATKDQQRVAGKWRACHPPSNFHKGKVFIRPEGSEMLIATVSAELRIPESIYAGRLMAAAPDLLAALRALANEAGGILSAAEPMLREAIGNTNYAVLAMRVREADAAIAKATV